MHVRVSTGLGLSASVHTSYTNNAVRLSSSPRPSNGDHLWNVGWSCQGGHQPGILGTQALWGSRPTPAAPTVHTHLPVCHWISKTRVSLCRLLQTLPKITPGIAQIDEG